MPLTRRDMLKRIGYGAAVGALATAGVPLAAWGDERNGNRTNVLLFTADDMNCDSVGVYGCKTPQITPNIDRLAGEGVRFEHAHITIAVCQPCRSVLMTGRYPHRSGGEGFHRITKTDTPVLVERLRRAGYRCGILGKVGHSTPKGTVKWDMAHKAGQLGMGRDPESYGRYARWFIEEARRAGRPFFLMANSADPHRPFSGSAQERNRFRNTRITPPSRTYRTGEVAVPGFLSDLPQVRLEIAEYYSSVRRCDDTVGAVLRALDECRVRENTLVIFLSDHGMALPFAKTNCYLHSTRTPWIVRWPGKVRANAVDRKHFISGIDLMPAVLDALGLPQTAGMDGSSFLPALQGRAQSGRDKVFTQFHETSARKRFPMRCVQNARFGYIFNPWSDGKRAFRNESQSGRTMAAMRAAAKRDRGIAARVRHFLHRTVQEFYDFRRDPDALHNLVDDPRYASEVNALRAELERWMVSTGDPALEALRDRGSPEALRKFMSEQQSRAGRKRRRGKRR